MTTTKTPSFVRASEISMGTRKGVLTARYPVVARDLRGARITRLVCSCASCQEPVKVALHRFEAGRCPNCHN